MAAVFVGADFMGAALAGAAPAASSCLGPSPCDGRERLGGGAHGSRRCPTAPLPNPPLPSQGRESKLAASAAPAKAERGKAHAGTLPPRHLRTCQAPAACRSEEHTSELQSLMRISYAVFCLKKKKNTHTN